MDPLTWITEVVMSELPVEITFIAAGWLLKIIWTGARTRRRKPARSSSRNFGTIPSSQTTRKTTHTRHTRQCGMSVTSNSRNMLCLARFMGDHYMWGCGSSSA